MNSRARDIESSVKRIRAAIWEDYLDDRTNLIYDYRDPERDRHFPSPDEIAQEIPNAAGWSAGFEDCAIAGGAFLEGLVRGYQQTGDPQLADQARRIWAGLRTLGTVSPCRGFVCRGVLPSDNRSHYPNSSGDQYTLFCSGLYRYYHSDIATHEERAQIADLAVGIAEHVMGANMNILREDGEPSIFGGVGRDETAEGRAVRVAGPGVLQYLALAASTTGDPRWQNEYDRVRDEYDRLPLRRLEVEWGEEGLRETAVFILMQGAYLFRMLHDYETEPEAKEAYRQVLNRTGRFSVPLLSHFEANPQGPIGYGPMPDLDWRKDLHFFHEVNPHLKLDRLARRFPHYIMTWWEARPGLNCELKCLREPMEGLTAIMMSEDQDLIRANAERAGEMLATFPVEQAKTSASLFNAEAIFWRGREMGLW